MKKILVASRNPVKLEAALMGFRAIFPTEEFSIEGIDVPSGVSAQPFSDEETLQGALNRANAAYDHDANADYWVGLEGGIAEQKHGMEAFSWIVVRSRSQLGKGRSAAYLLPPVVAEMIRSGKELGEAMDFMFQTINSKQRDGAIGLLTAGVVDRARLYGMAVMLALVPFRNPGLYV